MCRNALPFCYPLLMNTEENLLPKQDVSYIMAKVSPYSYRYQEKAINKLTVDACNHGKAGR